MTRSYPIIVSLLIVLTLSVRSEEKTMIYVDDRILMLQEVLARLPKNTKALFELGLLYYKEKRLYDHAIKQWETLLEIDPGFSKVYFHLAWAHFFQKNNIIDAEKSALKAVQMAKNKGQTEELWYKDVLWLLEMIYREKGDLVSVAQYVEKRNDYASKHTGEIDSSLVIKKKREFLQQELKNMYGKPESY